jgi:hypothetical protein
MPTPSKLIDDWVRAVKRRPMDSRTEALSTQQKQPSATELNRKRPVLVRDPDFLKTLEKMYSPLLDVELTVRQDSDYTGDEALVQSLEEDYQDILGFHTYAKARDQTIERKEQDTNDYHKDLILKPIAKLARLILVQKAAQCTGKTDDECDSLLYRAKVVSQPGHFSIPDHVFEGMMGTTSKHLACIEDKNTNLGTKHGFSINNAVENKPKASADSALVRGVWQQASICHHLTNLSSNKCYRLGGNPVSRERLPFWQIDFFVWWHMVLLEDGRGG